MNFVYFGALVLLSFGSQSSGLEMARTSSTVTMQTVWEKVSVNTGGGGIPKIIHQIWNTNELTGMLKTFSESWKSCLPGWEYRLHTVRDNRNFVATHFPEFLETYDNYPQEIQRIDAARYALLAVDGGIYVDMDMECLRDPSPIFDAMGNASGLLTSFGGQVTNAFMASGAVEHEFFKEVVSFLPEYANTSSVLDSTGPLFLGNAVSKLEGLTLDDIPKGLDTQTRTARGKSGRDLLLVGGPLVQATNAVKFFGKPEFSCGSGPICADISPTTYMLHWAMRLWQRPEEQVHFADIMPSKFPCASCPCSCTNSIGETSSFVTPLLAPHW